MSEPISHWLEIVDEGDGPYGDCACGWQTPIQPSMHDVARLFVAHKERGESPWPTCE